jgi:hypothetical protein
VAVELFVPRPTRLPEQATFYAWVQGSSPWRRLAAAATTLWFWNTEVGWATVHPLLAEHGWEYVQAITWDKGIRHVAGNVNGQTIRKFPSPILAT